MGLNPGGGRQASFDRKRGNSSPLRRDYWDWVDVQSLHPLTHDGGERFIEVGRLGYGDRHHDEPKTWCRPLVLILESGKGSGIFGAVDDADALNARPDLLEQLQVLSSTVSSWFTIPVMLPPGRASDLMNPRPTCTPVPTMTMGIVRGSAPRSVERFRVGCHDDIDLKRIEFRRPTRRSALDPAQHNALQYHTLRPSSHRGLRRPSNSACNTGLSTGPTISLQTGHPRGVVCRRVGSKPATRGR